MTVQGRRGCSFANRGRPGITRRAVSDSKPYVVPAPQQGETGLDALKRQVQQIGGGHLIETKLSPGEFYPRMARPDDWFPNESPGMYPAIEPIKAEVAIARGQLV